MSADEEKRGILGGHQDAFPRVDERAAKDALHVRVQGLLLLRFRLPQRGQEDPEYVVDRSTRQ